MQSALLQLNRVIDAEVPVKSQQPSGLKFSNNYWIIIIIVLH